MQRNFIKELVEKPQRETAGPDTSARFDYQKDWAFCEMIRRHMAGADYLVAFEFHDDVVFLSPASAPHDVDFVQVKTSASPSPRPPSYLWSRKKGRNSILGKLFSNLDGICSGKHIRVILVSNVPFSFSSVDVAAKDLDPKHRQKIIDKLKEELPTFDEANIDKLHFLVSNVGLHSMQSYLAGEAMELFKHRFGEEHGLNIHSWICLVQSEISRKNNYPSHKIPNVDELIARKCISRTSIANSLTLMVSKKSTAPDVATINNALITAGWSELDIMKTTKALSEAMLDFTDASNSDAAKLIGSLGELYDSGHPTTMATFLDLAATKLLSSLKPPYDNRYYLNALAILVYYEKL